MELEYFHDVHTRITSRGKEVVRMRYDGNLYDLEQHDRQCDQWLESLPVCYSCGDRIQDDRYEVNTGTGIHDLCEECARLKAEELAEDFIRDLLEEWKR